MLRARRPRPAAVHSARSTPCTMHGRRRRHGEIVRVFRGTQDAWGSSHRMALDVTIVVFVVTYALLIWTIVREARRYPRAFRAPSRRRGRLIPLPRTRTRRPLGTGVARQRSA